MDTVTSTRLFCDSVHYYELGISLPAGKDNSFEAFGHAGHTAASLHILLLRDRLRLYIDGSNEHLVT